MPRWVGFLGSWALLVPALGLAAFAVAGEWINVRDIRRLDRVAMIDEMIAERTGNKAGQLRQTAARRAAEVNHVRRDGQMVFQAVCSTGKGSTLAIDGHTWVFDTPIGKLRIVAKEENPEWVPPDWHYIEEARKNGMRVVHLEPGQPIDARSGDPSSGRSEGIWSWFGGGKSGPVLKVKGNTVVEADGNIERELPEGKIITAGDAIVVPPTNTKQRHFKGILGRYRLELGDGYGIHGTDQPDKLGQSVSHGCVRLGDQDIATLYAMANVGDTVIIY